MSELAMSELDFDHPETLSGFISFGGIHVASVGEDGDALMLGHHDDETTWAAFNAYEVDRNGETPESPPSDYYDLRRTFGVFGEHSEGCEQDGCTCREDNNCSACLNGDHGACEGEKVCDCASDYDHEGGCGECTSCECYCDEYAWWVANTKSGHPVTWVSFSYARARERHAASTAPPTPGSEPTMPDVSESESAAGEVGL